MNRIIAACASIILSSAVLAQVPAAGYANDFEKVQLGKAPDELLVLAGNFTVEQEQGNRFLRVAPTPLEGFCVLFGSDDATTTAVEARIRATAVKKRNPEFGIGLSGPGGYRIWLMPATGELQLIKGDAVKARKPYAWTSGVWTHLKLQVQPAGEGKWKVSGKSWPEGQPEPADWSLVFDETDKPASGRASAWGSPYPETPIDFDDLKAGAAR